MFCFFLFSLLNTADTNSRLLNFLPCLIFCLTYITISSSDAYDTVKVTMKHMGEIGIGNSKHISHWHPTYSLFPLTWWKQQICRMSTWHVLSFRVISLVPNYCPRQILKFKIYFIGYLDTAKQTWYALKCAQNVML